MVSKPSAHEVGNPCSGSYVPGTGAAGPGRGGAGPERGPGASPEPGAAGGLRAPHPRAGGGLDSPGDADIFRIWSETAVPSAACP